MSEKPNGILCRDFINGNVWVKRDNLTIEQCALRCLQLAEIALSESGIRAMKTCADAIRELKKPEDSDD